MAKALNSKRVNRTKRIVTFMVLLTAIVFTACNRPDQSKTDHLTAINPLAYTDVVYNSPRDTVIVSTYSGRIAQRINGQPEEHIISQLDDEIYSLAYSKKRDEILATTLRSGILVLDAKTGVSKRSLKVNKWCISLSLSEDEKYLISTDVRGRNYIWDISENFQLIECPDIFRQSYVRRMDDSGTIYLAKGGKTVLYNLAEELIVKEIAVSGKLVDVDRDGNLLFINHNEFSKFNFIDDSIEFKLKHPNWPYILASGDTAYIPPQMKLTTARFANNNIYTAGLDRSIRVWDSQNGKLLNDCLGHKATISSIQISGDSKQLVSVDLKGGIKFWDLE